MLAALVDFVIAMAVLEALGLAWWRQRTGRGPSLAELATLLGAGLCLMAALRCAVAGAGVVWVAAWLTAAGLAHVLDLRRRWRRG